MTAYSDLLSRVTRALKDTSLEDQVPTWISLAEARFNRLLYPLNDETTATSTAAATVALPSDFKAMRSLHIEDDPSSVLAQLSPDDFRVKYLDASTGKPVDYAIVGGSLLLGPEPDESYTLTLTYVKGITALTSGNPTNWLIEAHPDLYYFGVLMYAELDGWNDERAHDFDGAVDRIIGEIRLADAHKRRGDLTATVAGTYY
jgi:hypothetical protein